MLDSVTLANLDILVNQSTGTAEGSLIERLDYCKTGGGKRLLREWLSAPLCDHNLINVSMGLCVRYCKIRIRSIAPEPLPIRWNYQFTNIGMMNYHRMSQRCNLSQILNF